MPPTSASTSSGTGSSSKAARRWSVASGPYSFSSKTRSRTSVRASGICRLSASRSPKRCTSTPRSRSTSANPSCSARARRTHSTSSKSKASLFEGVSRFSSRSGRCRMTRRSRPASESTWNPIHPSWPLGRPRGGSRGMSGRGRRSPAPSPSPPSPRLQPWVHRLRLQREHREDRLVHPPQRFAVRQPVERLQAERVLPQGQRALVAEMAYAQPPRGSPGGCTRARR